MAEVVETYKFKAERAGVDWDRVLDGQTWFLERGVDFDAAIPTESFRGIAYAAGRSRGLKVQVNKAVNGSRSGFYVKATKAET